MAREPLRSADVRIDQPSPLAGDLDEREPEIVLVDRDLLDKEYADELAFMAEWVTIRLEPSGQENAPDTFPVSTNGKGAEILINGRPVIWTWLPVGEEVTVRRHTVEIIARSKTMRVQTEHMGELVQQRANKLDRRVSQTQPFSIIHDPSPRGRAWLAEMIRRPF
jgi:hypothetical protein